MVSYLPVFPKIQLLFSPNFCLARKSAAVGGGWDTEEFENAALQVG